MCGFADEIVSYIYDEIGTPERRKFEKHLIDCSVCTDEFATISNARFAVFEWRREEFAHLATPEIIIPYAPKRSVEENISTGFLVGLRGLLSGSGWPLTVAAALVVCLGVGYAAITFLGRGEQQTAANSKFDEPTVRPVITREIPAKAVPENVVTTNSKNNAATTREERPVKAVENRRPRPERQMTAGTQTPGKVLINQRTPQSSKAPVLSNYDDNDDKSLRLSDLFDDDIGVRR